MRQSPPTHYAPLLARLMLMNLLLTACGKNEPPASKNQLPVARIILPGSNLTIHQGEVVSFGAACTDSDGTPGDLFSHRWDFGDGTSAETLDPKHAFAQAGTFVVRYACIDSDGGISTEVNIEVTTDNSPPEITALAPYPTNPLVLMVGMQLDLSVTCSDPDVEDGAPLIAWSLADQDIAGDGARDPNRLVTIAQIGQLDFKVTCTDPWGLSISQVRSVDARPTPTPLYLSTEQQLAYADLLYADVPGAPQVLNDALLAPGGRVETLALAAGDVYYSADHTIQGRQQLYRVSPATPGAATTITAPLQRGSAQLHTTPDGQALIYLGEQNTPGQTEIYYIDASATNPSARQLNPTLAANASISGYTFSPSGRYLAFWASYQPSNGSFVVDIYIADLNGNDPAVVVAEAVTSTNNPLVFSADNAYAVFGDREDLKALNLSTLSDATPVIPSIVSTPRGGIVGFRFVTAGPVLAYIAKKSGAPKPGLHILDVATALDTIANNEFDVLAYEPPGEALLKGTFTTSLPFSLCDDVLILSQKTTSATELFYVDIQAWLTAERTTPGTGTAPQKLHRDLNAGETAYTNLTAFSADCSAYAFQLALDDDSDIGTPNIISIQVATWSALGTPTEITSGANYGGGGIFSPIAFSPDASKLLWTEQTNAFEARPWVSAVTAPSPVQLMADLVVAGGANDTSDMRETFWLDNDRILVEVNDGTDPGLYRWAFSNPQAPTRLTPSNFQGKSQGLIYDGTALYYRHDFTNSIRSIAMVAVDKPGVESKLNANGVTNGAQISKAWLTGGGGTALYTAENINENQFRLYAVEVESPGTPVELYPGDIASTFRVSASSVFPLHASAEVIFLGYENGQGRLLKTAIDASITPTALDIAPAIRVLQVIAVSADERWVLYRAASNGGKLYLRGLAETDVPIELSANTIDTARSGFSPDGRYARVTLTGNPKRAYIVDTQASAPSLIALTPDDLPTQLPQSAQENSLAPTSGTFDVMFAQDGSYVYYSYDSVYARHLRVVRRALGVDASIGPEELVHGPVAPKEKVQTWQITEDGAYMVFKKLVYPDPLLDSPTSRLFSVDTTDLGVDIPLTLTFNAGAQGTISFDIFGHDVIASAVASTTSGTNLYLVPLADPKSPTILNAPLATLASLRGRTVWRAADHVYVAYSAMHKEDTAAQLYVADIAANSVARSRITLGNPDTILTALSNDNAFLWLVAPQSGQCDGLFVRALSYPKASLRFSGVPITDGCPDLPVE